MEIISYAKVPEKVRSAVYQWLGDIHQSHQQSMTLFLGNEFNVYAEMPSLYVASNGDRIVAIATVYHDDVYQPPEINLVVHPNERKQGISRQLIYQIEQEHQRFRVLPPIFSIEQIFIEAHPTFVERLKGFDLEPVTRRMQLHARVIDTDFDAESICIRTMTESDCQEVAQELADLFESSEEEELKRCQIIQNCSHLIGYVIALKATHQIIGVCYIDQISEAVSYLFSVGIWKQYQNKGYGTQGLAMIIKHLNDKGVQTVELEVDPNNRSAVSMYQKLGFQSITLCMECQGYIN